MGLCCLSLLQSMLPGFHEFITVSCSFPVILQVKAACSAANNTIGDCMIFRMFFSFPFCVPCLILRRFRFFEAGDYQWNSCCLSEHCLECFGEAHHDGNNTNSPPK